MAPWNKSKTSKDVYRNIGTGSTTTGLDTRAQVNADARQNAVTTVSPQVTTKTTAKSGDGVTFLTNSGLGQMTEQESSMARAKRHLLK